MSARRSRRRRWILVLAALVLIAALGALAWPDASEPPRAHPRPAATYAQALDRYRSLLATEARDLTPGCETRLLTLGHRTPRALVMVHGFTNCPEQFAALATECHDRGDNVVLVRLPEHGGADRRGPTLGRITAERVAAATDAAIDMACGLGDSVIVVGLSVGGVAAAWAGEQRRDVARVVVLSPLIGLAGIPAPLTRALIRVWRLAPDSFHWWDDRARDHLAGAGDAYWGWSTRGLAAMLHFGATVGAEAAREAPRARELVLVTNAHDATIDNTRARAMARGWAARAPGRVRVWEFPDSLRLGHDLIDPAQPDQRVSEVYPVLLRLTSGAGIPLVVR